MKQSLPKSVNSMGYGPTPSLTRNTAWMLTGHGCRLAIQAAYFIALARVLGPADFGAFLAVLVITTAVAPFAGWGLGPVLILRSARSGLEYSDALYRFAVTLAITAPVLLGLQVLWFRWWAPGTSLVFVLLIGLSELFLFKLTEVSSQAFQAHERLSGTATLLALAAFGRLIAAGVLAVTQGGLAEWGFYYFLATLVTAAVAVWMMIRRFGSPKRALGQSAQLGLGSYFALGTAAKATYTDLDKAILLRLAGDATAGVYGAAYKIVTVSFAPVQALLAAASARFFRSGADGVRGSFATAKKIMPSTLALGLFSAATLFLAAPLVPRILGEDYVEASRVVRWLAPLPFLQGIHYVFAEALSGAGRQAARTTVLIASAGFNGLLNVLFVGAYGWAASAAASIATELVLIIAMSGMVWHFVASQRRNSSDART